MTRSFGGADVATASRSHLSLRSRSLVGRSDLLLCALFALIFDCGSVEAKLELRASRLVSISFCIKVRAPTFYYFSPF